MITERLKEKLKEECGSLSIFLYGSPEVLDKWIVFCDKKRGGNQSLEALSTLVSSLDKWRDIVDIVRKKGEK